MRNPLPFLCLLLCFCSTIAFAQKETEYWYFGENAGIRFVNSVPGSLGNGALNTDEGCSTISDSLGNLLFYTDGIKVWNNLHQQMPNGHGLLGDPSASQSALIIKKPGSKNIYYIFTTAARAEAPGFRYSVVDLSLANGKGDVTQKNVLLLTPSTEKITAVNHRNDQSVWVIAHRWNSNSFYAYPITSNGVGTPVISSTGTRHEGYFENSMGCMKASPDGTKLALAIELSRTFELFDFNDVTGEVSNPMKFTATDFNWAYGVEFSPDGTRLYCTRMGVPGGIYQFDLSAGREDSIKSTVAMLGDTRAQRIGALQLGRDGRIYVAIADAVFIGAILSPNSLGGGSVFTESFVQLNGKKSLLGLPGFNQSYFFVPSFKHEKICFGDTTQFTLRVPYKFTSVTWNFDDSLSGSANTSTQFNPVHRFTKAGSYFIKVTGTLQNGQVRTSTTRITILAPPAVNLGPDTVICAGAELTLKPKSSFTKYRWSTGEESAEIKVNKPGTYWLDVYNSSGCVNRDSIVVSVPRPPVAFAEKVHEICFGDAVTINTLLQNVTVTWPDSSKGPSYTTKAGGYHKIYFTFKGCTVYDSVKVSFSNCPEKFEIPNVITPNGDQQNEAFIVRGIAPGLIELTVYNRWGNVVYKSDSYQQNWRAENVGAGTYYYNLRIKETNQTYKGWLEVIL
ncbi:MAG: gliding motility-associated C-terminal domain-containing protein [Hymenobacteraceae bacterium]|nr:gliding motility-associated C-terminal domain-containing protein [Hymenobacteraceae bacterium]MDX5397875.1 gliding motility-associated C-terminal domain-containing protein [Hymenobacteraceae bacterium]MDX5444059.1 gliding motility-associated C-terminal domain-containing protein [Hymenobacteraceae bacterium]MDX5513946.1 gliding motility-associated C-terminal domain-containing protein [Hymenobacteraceae bacterium]